MDYKPSHDDEPKHQPPNVKRKTKRSETNASGSFGFPAGVRVMDTGHGDKLEIKKLETSKDMIEQPDFAKDEMQLIPSRGYSIIINGASGSGKSTLLANYAKNPHFFGPSKERPNGWFDKIFLFSPTADGDDIQRSLGIPKHHVCTDMDEAPAWIETIFKSQKSKLDGGGKAHRVPQYWFIFDDVIGETQFMNNKIFKQCWYMIRHRNGTTTCCTQYYKKLPKVCRQQASFIHFFAGNQAEVEQIVEDFAPPLYTKKEFRDLVTCATLTQYHFLTVCMKVQWAYRFRQNLGKILVLERLIPHQDPDTLQTKSKRGEESDEEDTSQKKICDTNDKTPEKKQRLTDTKFSNSEVQTAVETLLKALIDKHERNHEQTHARLR